MFMLTGIEAVQCDYLEHDLSLRPQYSNCFITSGSNTKTSRMVCPYQTPSMHWTKCKSSWSDSSLAPQIAAWGHKNATSFQHHDLKRWRRRRHVLREKRSVLSYRETLLSPSGYPLQTLSTFITLRCLKDATTVLGRRGLELLTLQGGWVKTLNSRLQQSTSHSVTRSRCVEVAAEGHPLGKHQGSMRGM